ncbi:hypothetical protein LMIY3S_02837 [Labrys miyagiensis]
MTYFIVGNQRVVLKVTVFYFPVPALCCSQAPDSVSSWELRASDIGSRIAAKLHLAISISAFRQVAGRFRTVSTLDGHRSEKSSPSMPISLAHVSSSEEAASSTVEPAGFSKLVRRAAEYRETCLLAVIMAAMPETPFAPKSCGKETLPCLNELGRRVVPAPRFHRIDHPPAFPAAGGGASPVCRRPVRRA